MQEGSETMKRDFAWFACILAGMAVTLLIVLRFSATPGTSRPEHPAKRIPRSAPRCRPYTPYPNTLICSNRRLYHVQSGKLFFMGDLGQPHSPMPSVPQG